MLAVLATKARPKPGFPEPPAKRLNAGPNGAEGDVFAASGGREAYMAVHVHRRLHPMASILSDEELLALGKQSFNEQFHTLEQHPKEDGVPSSIFGGVGRQAYTASRIHRRLHAQVQALSDEQLYEVGQKSFNAQFDLIAELTGAPVPTGPAQISVPGGDASDPFGGAGRDAFMQQRVHRKLHREASTLDDEALAALGKLSFNEQFPALEQHTASMAVAARDGRIEGTELFPGGRDVFVATRVHRKLHSRVTALSDSALYELGMLSFTKQFDEVERMMESLAQETGDLFGGLGREQYMGTRVHRKLHLQAGMLTDEELLELGKLSFNAQFPFVEERLAGVTISATESSVQGQEEAVDAGFGPGVTREDYLRARVHRRLHSQVTSLSDQELLELGKLSFNKQFDTLEAGAIESAGTSLSAVRGSETFEGLTREEFIQERVQDDLQAAAQQLTDDQLVELAGHSFDVQPIVIDQMADELVDAGLVDTIDSNDEVAHRQPQSVSRGYDADAPVDFGAGVSRELYLQTRVHRKLHAQAVELTDEELLLLGQLKFNDQFKHFETHELASAPAVDGGGVFGNLTREQYMSQRVHRRLHVKASALGDEELYALGQMSFIKQFPALGEGV